MVVEESPCSCLLSVFVARRALLYDVRDRLPLLGTLQNTVFYSVFVKIPFLHNAHATGINNIHIFISSSSFFFFVNSSMKPPKLARVSTE